MALSDVFASIQKKLDFTKSVEISGIKFELGLLSFDQELKTEAVPQEDLEPLAYYNQIRLQTLAYSIRSLNGEKIPAVIETKKGEVTEKKQGTLYVKEFISTLPSKVIEQIYDAYIDIKEEADASLDKEIQYTWFKTPEQREAEAKAKKEESSKEEQKETGSDEEEIKLREIPESHEEEKPVA